MFFDLQRISVMKGSCCVINYLIGELKFIHELAESLIHWGGVSNIKLGFKLKQRKNNTKKYLKSDPYHYFSSLQMFCARN